ncbi:FKBP-type peptidyl-prolyl cis-trans isomerase [Tsuneonella sp. YG55]|uniref:Peptidyl-prolyl cis-trans isomerase n=1 Tax=Tsuneonella litorea TaxID=2976475 RepID=A0A9X2W369_9SPHN|nr:FKBP-type peptidyl-prolyl cis-trans isomerase [Tsuneonella litorea]MCT2559912.1 FKBP-type peptidyl-prolyl cis-trans isomerase [Tsuneonella litorea]
MTWKFAGESGATLALGAALIAGAAALAQDGGAGAPPDRSQDMAWVSAQQAALAERAAQPGWQTAEGGVLWRRVAGSGEGKRPTVRDVVTVHYTGTFVDGAVFDSSEGGEPATFPLGRLIPAWQVAIPQMAVGDTIEIAAPATAAYGMKGKGPIPGGATLLFTVRLLAIDE